MDCAQRTHVTLWAVTILGAALLPAIANADEPPPAADDSDWWSLAPLRRPSLPM